MKQNRAIKLLAIDDKPDNLTTVSALVREALPQTTVLTATNGPAGIALAAAEDPDVILLDIVMPGMDGFEVCRRLKADERIEDIPVVFITAIRTDSASRVRALEAGAEGFLAKPLEPFELTAQIRAMVKVKAANRSRRIEKSELEALVAERRQALRESESRHRAMFENMAAASCVDEIVYENGRAVDYRILDVNPAFERITGIRRQDATGALASELYGLGQAPFLAEYSRVAETGEPVEFEAWFEPLQKHLHITVGRPKPGFFSTVFTDITERKRAEETIQHSRELYSSLVENLPQSVFRKDREGRFLFCNQRFCDGAGHTREEVLGKTDADFYPPEMAESYRQDDLRVMQSGQVLDQVEEHVGADGRKLFVQVVKTPLWDASGGIIGIQGIFWDITERKRADEALRESEERLRAILDATPFPIAVVDTGDNVIHHWSRSAHQMFGHTAPTTPEWYRIAYPDPAYRQAVIERWKPFVETARRTGETVNAGEYRVSCRDGSVRICELHASFVMNILIVTFNDITTRKRAEIALQQRNAELEQWHAATVGRELRMVELKNQVNDLSRQLGQPVPYPMDFGQETPRP